MKKIINLNNSAYKVGKFYFQENKTALNILEITIVNLKCITRSYYQMNRLNNQVFRKDKNAFVIPECSLVTNTEKCLVDFISKLYDVIITANRVSGKYIINLICIVFII